LKKSGLKCPLWARNTLAAHSRASMNVSASASPPKMISTPPFPPFGSITLTRISVDASSSNRKTTRPPWPLSPPHGPFVPTVTLRILALVIVRLIACNYRRLSPPIATHWPAQGQRPGFPPDIRPHGQPQIGLLCPAQPSIKSSPQRKETIPLQFPIDRQPILACPLGPLLSGNRP